MLQNFKIKTKVSLVVSLLSVVSLIGASVLSYRAWHTDAQYSRFIARDDAGLVLLVQASNRLNRLYYASYRVMSYDGASVEARQAFEHYQDNVKVLYGLLDKAVTTSPEEAGRLNEYRQRVDTIRALTDQANEAGLKNDEKRSVELLHQADVFGTSLRDDMERYADQQGARIQRQAQALSVGTLRLIWWGMAAIVVGIALSNAVALYVGKVGIVVPLMRLNRRVVTLADGELEAPVEGQERGDEIGVMARAVRVLRDQGEAARRLAAESAALREQADREQARRAAEKAAEIAQDQAVTDALRKGLAAVAEGNLAYRITVAFPERAEAMKADFNAALASVQQTMSAVQGAVAAIGSGASQIAVASTDMSRRTEQQAASIEESAAALGHVTTMVQGAAENARKAASVTEEARDGARKSGVVVQAAVTAMGKIESSFSQISQVIGLIDEIAFQTNLLALNASVEAARAGEAGRGFAVVATEVRTLAQRSAEGAKEIKALVSSSGGYVTEGVKLVDEGGHVVQAIAEQVEQINGLVGEIAKAAVTQSTAIAEINMAVGEMSRTTQQNAAMVDESTTAIASLDREAGALRQRVAQFRLGDEEVRGAVPVPKGRREGVPPARAVRDDHALALVDAGWEDFR